MKKIAILSFIFLVSNICVYGIYDPDIEFTKTTIDYGKINKGENGIKIFEFKNNGTSPLKINQVYSSCGCTIPKYPKNIAIKPGENSGIEINFDSSGWTNLQSKLIRISANTPTGSSFIRIQAFVEPKNN